MWYNLLKPILHVQVIELPKQKTFNDTSQKRYQDQNILITYSHFNPKWSV